MWIKIFKYNHLRIWTPKGTRIFELRNETLGKSKWIGINNSGN